MSRYAIWIEDRAKPSNRKTISTHDTLNEAQVRLANYAEWDTRGTLKFGIEEIEES